MNGYKIYYLDELGKSAFTWFGEPLMSDGFRWSFNKLDMVLLMFENAHKGCKVVRIEECTLEEYEKSRCSASCFAGV